VVAATRARRADEGLRIIGMITEVLC
jgi:hypothetical protein